MIPVHNGCEGPTQRVLVTLASAASLPVCQQPNLVGEPLKVRVELTVGHVTIRGAVPNTGTTWSNFLAADLLDVFHGCAWRLNVSSPSVGFCKVWRTEADIPHAQLSEVLLLLFGKTFPHASSVAQLRCCLEPVRLASVQGLDGGLIRVEIGIDAALLWIIGFRVAAAICGRTVLPVLVTAEAHPALLNGKVRMGDASHRALFVVHIGTTHPH
mmetsp:Transcript_23457/g.54691  ORF Transcript_23457/g.54691 Transcript_23457/m.54691 type:complete len:213 (-) Transcript_23457:3148-3786(-)